MHHVAIEDVEPAPYDEYHDDRRDLSDPLSASNVAIVRYVLEPGERFSGSVHAHADQEEVFVVLEGEATFETRTDEVTVGTNEAIRFAPGEFQSGWNDADATLTALALGAPPDSEDVRVTRIPVLGDRTVECPECGHDHMRIASEATHDLTCPACGAGLDVE